MDEEDRAWLAPVHINWERPLPPDSDPSEDSKGAGIPVSHAIEMIGGIVPGRSPMLSPQFLEELTARRTPVCVSVLVESERFSLGGTRSR